jgi:ketosteroid isomerase-like protein
MTSPTIQRWHEIVRSRDLEGLDALLADDVVFESPVVHTPQRGKAITAKYLLAALLVLNNDSFEYLGEWTAEHSAVLEFQCTVDGVVINGVDMIEWNADGRISGFKVMVRPLKAMNKLHEMMGAMLQRGAYPSTDS